MWRPSKPVVPVILLAVLASAASGAQSASHARYLRDRQLDDVYAEYLLQQLESASGSERAAVAQKLAGVYLDLLQDDQAVAGRQRWAERASTLLRSVPEADSPELRLGLAQAAYLNAEETAERHVLLLATERDIADALRILREVTPAFVSLAQQSHQRAQQLERELAKQLERAREDEISLSLAEARRMRSIAFYYAGWSSYYSAELSGVQQGADQALRHFGWILGARDGAQATVDQLQTSLLRFEHVARAAVGAALACSLSGRSIEARAWLDAVERSTETSQAIRDTIPARRVRVLSDADAWPDIDTIARRKLASMNETPDPTFARLVCILSLERLKTPGGRHTQLVRRLAQDALASLVRADEIGHVTDLARRFGTDLLDADGFVSRYVRAVMTRDDARVLAQRHGNDHPRVVAALLDAAEQLTAASSSSDAERFPAERDRAMFNAGQSLFEAGRLEEASEVFERCQAVAESEDQRRQAAWMRVVTLERAAEGGDASLTEARDQAALLYLAAYPNTDQAAQLALRASTARLLTEGQAAAILLSVPSGAPTFAAARRRAASLLYRRYRSADPLERPLIVDQFLSISEEMLAQDGRALREAGPSEAEMLAETMVLAARRLADVALAAEPPEIERAVFALDVIDRVSDYTDTEQDELQDELMFRRLQIASHQSEVDIAAKLAEQLASSQSRFGPVAAQVMYRDSVRLWIADQSDASAAQRVVRFGSAILPSLEERVSAKASVLQTIAEAAEFIATKGEAEEFIRKAVDAREALVSLGQADDEQLRALALGYAQLGEAAKAAETWLTVLQRTPQSSLGWYEARLESLRQLERTDPDRARDAAMQFRALHPDLGPLRYRDAFRELLSRLLDSGSGGA